MARYNPRGEVYDKYNDTSQPKDAFFVYLQEC